MKKPVKEIKKKSIAKTYNGITPFINKKFSPLEFESYCSNKINLFNVDPNFNFAEVEADADRIIKRLFSIKRIFERPIIDLIDVNNIIPVESVKKIYSKTIEYAINHSTTIDNILEDESVKPRRLLSIEYQVKYDTYENRTFTYLVNLLLRFTKSNLLTLNNYLFINNDEININILEKLNHPDYYLATGKLHTSYIRNFEQSFEDINRLINKLRLIYDILTARLKNKVYVKCNAVKKKGRRYRLKKTNIFRNQKDYKNIYYLLRYMLLNYETMMNDSYDTSELDKLKKPYFTFVQILLLFSLMHFNFIIQSNKKIDFKKLNVNLRFKTYRVHVEKKSVKDIDYISVEVKKNKTYKFMLYCGHNPFNALIEMETLKHSVKANEYLLLSPFANDIDATYISVNNIDSFRRIQQFVLRGMIYADNKHDICPFCGEKLIKRRYNGETVYECDKCRTRIKKNICPETKKPYYSTSIINYKNYVAGLKDKQKNAWLYAHNIESQMYFRNINELDYMMDERCPHCGEVHQNKAIISK